MPITPLPQFEADLAEHLREQEDREAYARLNVPTTVVVRFGVTKMIAELPYEGDTKPGCGSKLVCTTHRGTELCEMLTSTCPNAGCSKSVTRREMLEYIENSGGKDYPFHDGEDGRRVLRIASAEDLNRHSALEQKANEIKMGARRVAERLGLEMQVVAAEPILGGETLTIYYLSEDRVDFREMVGVLASEHKTRIEMRQIGARDEARINADYERCGQHCCCKGFLKVLKPVSMKSAKMQKATLDPLKISGRCGRLMCCLRYEDQTYRDLKSNLPHRKSRVGTPEGDGYVIDSQILTQLVLVRLDKGGDAAIPVEDLAEPKSAEPQRDEPKRDASRPTEKPRKRKRRPADRERPGTDDRGTQSESRQDDAANEERSEGQPEGGDSPKRKRRRRRRRKPGGDGEAGNQAGPGPDRPE